MAESSSPAPAANLNDKWKALDGIFQAQLKRYVSQSNRAAFDELADEFGFNDTQKDLLFRCIHTFTEDVGVPTTRSGHFKALSPMGSNPSNPSGDDNHNSKQAEPAKSATTSLTTMDHPQTQTQLQNGQNGQNGTRAKKSLFAIPNSKQQRLSGSKRKRSSSASEEGDDSSSKKKQKKTKEELQNEKNGIFVVEAIEDHRRLSQNMYEYRIKWRHYDECSWEPPAHLQPETLREYWQGRGMKKDPEGAVRYLKKPKAPVSNKATSGKSPARKVRQKRRRNESPAKNGTAKVYECCGKTFKNGWALGGHKAAVHSRISPKKKKPRVEAYWEDSESDSDDDDDDEDVLVEEK